VTAGDSAVDDGGDIDVSRADVDLVVVTFNSCHGLSTAVGPLLDHTNLVVVDNDSSDDSVAIARDLGIEVIANSDNRGFGRAATQGAAVGSASFILFLNPDAAIEPQTLARLVDRLEDDPRLAVVSPQLVAPDGSRQRTWWPFPSSRRAWSEALHIGRWCDPTPTGFVIGACFLIRRSVFETLGGFDERYWLYGEETDLCRRAADLGFGIELADDLRADHVGGASATGIEGVVFEHFERAGELFVLDHEGRLGLLSYRLANLTGATIRAVAHRRSDGRRLHRARAMRIAGLLIHAPLSVPEAPRPT
jgi:N-acetylglucosaminyl-diphospho-decaprenol L-rhamnosyltransferase